jgi:phage gp45-like
MPRNADHLTDISDVLGSDVTNGEVYLNVGDSIDGDGWGANAAIWGPDGYIAVPNSASQGSACRALYLVDGNTKRVFACRDNRIATRAGGLSPGDRAIVTDAAPRVRIIKQTEVVELYTENAGNPVQVVLDGPNDTILLENAQATSVTISGDSTTITAGNSTATVSASSGISAAVGATELTIAPSGNVTVTFAGVPVFEVTAGAPSGALLPVALQSGPGTVPSTKVYGLP